MRDKPFPPGDIEQRVERRHIGYLLGYSYMERARTAHLVGQYAHELITKLDPGQFQVHMPHQGRCPRPRRPTRARRDYRRR